MACPAGTMFRNYFAMPGGAAQTKGNQIDTAADIHALLQKELGQQQRQQQPQQIWNMVNGYLLPVERGCMMAVATKMAADASLSARIS